MSSIQDYYNIHSNDRVFLIGNGPSLQQTPLNLIEDEHSIAMNRIDLLYEKTDWRPDYYIQLHDPSQLAEERKESMINSINLDIPCFLNSKIKNVIQNRNNLFYIDTEISTEDTLDKHILNSLDSNSYLNVWSNDIEKKVYNFGTMYGASQIANYMGFSEIYFLGCDLYPIFGPDEKLPERLFERGGKPTDFDPESEDVSKYIEFINFSMKSKYPLSTALNGIWFKIRPETIRKLYKIYNILNLIENSHFSSKYYNYEINPVFFNKDKNRIERKIHRYIFEIGKMEGFKCFNATIGGKLDVHERIDLNDILS